MKKIVGIVAAAVLIVPLLLLLLLSSTPKITLDPALKNIGVATPVGAQIDDSHGVRRVTASLEQNGKSYPVFEQTGSARRFLFWTSRQSPQSLRFEAGSKLAPAIKDGQAQLVLSAVSNDFRGSSASVRRDVQIVTRPPVITTDSAQHYINQGGAELVTFSIDGYATDSGVKVGPYTFRSFPLPTGSQRVSLFAFPWDLPVTTIPVVYATNPAGNNATATFWVRVFPKKFRKRDIPLDDGFLNKAVTDIDPGGSGDLLRRFLKINRDMRQQNNRELAELSKKTADHFLWSQPFLRQEAKDESMFADVRSYIYKGKKVDEQVHLGYDLSNVQHTPILAANDGVVVHASRLGIYGNCIVLDHGLGLQTIYGHMSRLDVKPGDQVKKAQQLGLSGSTGLAAGDHLHFSMQIDGVQVDPKEWWDPHWIHDRIFSKLSPGSNAISANASTTEGMPQPNRPTSHTSAARARKARKRH